MVIELRYVCDGRYGDSSPSLSLDRLLHSLASQFTLQPIILQRDRSPSPPSVISTPMMHSQSWPWASCYSEPQPQYPHYYDDRSTWDHALGHSSAVHHNHIHPSPPYVEHQPVQVQASSHVSFPGAGDLRQPSPDAADDSRLHEYSAKSPRGKELFVSHLPSEMTDDKLRDLFSTYGVVIRASIARHKSGEPRSFAFVKFKHQGNADQALLHLNNYQIGSKHLFVDYATKQPRGRSLSYREYQKHVVAKSVVLTKSSVEEAVASLAMLCYALPCYDTFHLFGIGRNITI